MWQYLKYEPNGELAPNQPELPPKGFAFLGFDACRWQIVLGYREVGIGCLSMLTPQVDDDCQIVAFAPLCETAEPDIKTILESGPWQIPEVTSPSSIGLYRGSETPTP